MKLTEHKYVVIQHTIKHWNGMDVKYVKDDKELAELLFEIAKEQEVPVVDTGDIIDDVINATRVFHKVHIFELRDRRFTFGTKLLDDLLSKAEKVKEEA